MSDALRFEETVPEYYIVYKPLPKGHHGVRSVTVRPVATVEKRCGKWLWWMRNESDIGLADTFEGAKAAVTERVDRMPDGFVPPSRTQVRRVADQFCHSRHLDSALFDEDEFLAFYEANGWRTKGKVPMKDWRIAVRSWVKRVAGR